MPSCVVRGCSHAEKKRDPSRILHGFPKEPEKIKLWLHQTGQYGVDLDDMVVKVYLGKVYDTYRMCSLHFTNDSYRYDGYRRILKKDAVPTIFNKIKQSTVSGYLFSTSSEQHTLSATLTDDQKPSSSAVHIFRVEPQVIHPKPSLQPTIQRMTLVPVVPQRLIFQPCGISQKNNSVVSNTSSLVTTQPTAIKTSDAMHMHSAILNVNQQSTVSGPSTSSILEVPLSSSLSIKQSTSVNSELTASSHGSKLEKLPAKLQHNTSVPVTFVQKPPSSVLGETKPCSVTVLPVSGNVTPKTQTPSSISVVNNPLKIPDCQPPSKKRKLEENIAPSVLPSQSMSQTTVNTGKLYFVSSNAPVVQPSYLIPKPLMVDKGVNTDSFTNRKSCCIATDPMHRKRSVHTQTKIYRKHRKIMCTLILPYEPINDNNSDSTVSLASPEDIGFSDCSPSRSSDCGDDPLHILEPVNLDLVKVEILSDPEVDAPTFSDSKQAIHIKEESESVGQAVPLKSFKSTYTLPEFDISTMKTEPYIKTEEDQFPISSAHKVSNILSQNPQIERTSPIPSYPLAPGWRNLTSWETSAIPTDDELEDLNDSSFYINEMREDEDESFLLPSDAEDEDDIKPVFQDLDSPVENPVEEEKYIVFESCLKKLIMMIPCRSETKCMSPLTQYRKETIGSYLSIEVRCRSGHTSLLWESQPRHGYQPMGNVLLSAAVLFSGSSFLKSQHMFKLLNLKSIDKSTYYKTQSMYLFPTINHHWKEEQIAVIQSVQERPLCLAGDQQLDNPGFSARYSIYSMMDVASKKICSFSVQPVIPQVTLEGLEKIGFQKSMGELQTLNAEVKMIVTDRSVAIQELLKNNYPGIIHQLDLWHLSKSVGNEVLMAAKHKDCEIIYEWVEAIRNHIWWSSCTCCKNHDLLIEKWKSVLQHVTNVHEWGGDSDCKACHHPPLPEEVVNSANWLEKDSIAHEQLKKIVENTSLLKDLKRVSFLCHTGELEIYHTTCLKYRPKTLHFFLDSMVARTQLAALDHNRNVCRVKELVKNASSGNALSTMTQGLDVSKGQKSWIIKALYKSICHNFLFDIMNDVIGLVKEVQTFQ